MTTARKGKVRFDIFVFSLIAAAMLVLCQPQTAWGQTKLDFEDLPANYLITPQTQHYVALGVVIAPIDGIIATQPKPHSGAHVLLPSVREFYVGPFVIQFNSGQSQVSLFAGAIPQNQNDAVRGTLTAYDANGKKIAQDGPKLTTSGACATSFLVLVNTPTIVRAEVYLEEDFQNGNKSELPEAIDDLTFQGNPPPPLPQTPPMVQITAPMDQQQVDTGALAVTGTASGAGLPAAAMLTLEVQQPPNKPSVPPSVFTIPLVGNGLTRNFAITIQPGAGPQTITVQATNLGSLTGSAQVHITNLPSAIATQFGASGGAATFGNLQWAASGDGCTLAVYGQGAISNQGGITYTILDGIFTKWLQWILAKYDQLYALGVISFCPTEDERDAPGGARAQTFGRGRIYTRLAAGTLYVPDVFVQAIDTLGGEAATGVPLGDPASSPAARTWLFQRFMRPGGNSIPSTLEIKGASPELWIQRQGGDLTALMEGGLALTPSSPTLVQTFPCSASEGPCAVTAASSPPGVPHAIDAGAFYCAGQFDGGFTPEWVAIQGDFILTKLYGIVVDSHMAGIDNALTHENSYDSPGLASDWITLVKPIHPYKSLLATNLDMEVEIEEYFGHHFYTGWGYPKTGDLFFASGRWIIDCAHNPFKSEIHPPFVTAEMHTDSGTGAPVTIADIWVNGFYTGDAIDINLYPPPRPTPNAFLSFSKPFDNQAAVDVTVSYSADPDYFSYVLPHFSASSRHVTVTSKGEMLWQGGREYAGRWTVGWEQENQYSEISLSNNWWP